MPGGHCVSGAISVLAGIAAVQLQEELDADIDVIGTPDRRNRRREMRANQKKVSLITTIWQ